mmetsp:Transcript_5240/g.10383  ORF Transcript_5240/g.10383 Transcript_5240/m.10383 type:complete len:103 (-) Transcript_5240:218-526(-)
MIYWEEFWVLACVKGRDHRLGCGCALLRRPGTKEIILPYKEKRPNSREKIVSFQARSGRMRGERQARVRVWGFSADCLWLRKKDCVCDLQIPSQDASFPLKS